MTPVYQCPELGAVPWLTIRALRDASAIITINA
jgi:hypothetical protein